MDVSNFNDIFKALETMKSNAPTELDKNQEEMVTLHKIKELAGELFSTRAEYTYNRWKKEAERFFVSEQLKIVEDIGKSTGEVDVEALSKVLSYPEFRSVAKVGKGDLEKFEPTPGDPEEANKKGSVLLAKFYKILKEGNKKLSVKKMTKTELKEMA